MIALDASTSVELHDSSASNTLRQVLVGRTDDHALNTGILPRKKCGRGKRVIRLVLLHRPYHYTKRAERLF